MKINILKLKKEQYLEDILLTIDSQIKKASGMISDLNIKSIIFDFSIGSNEIENVYFDEENNISLVKKNESKDVVINDAFKIYLEETIPLIVFLVENYPVDSDDKIEVLNDKVVYDLRHKTTKSKLKI